MPIILDGTNGETFPSWTTAGRPSPVAPGQTGYNTTLNVLETYNGTSWQVSSVPAPTTTGNVLFTTNGTNWSSTPKITSGTVNAGGTNPFPGAGGPIVVDFIGIPAWVKRITVMLNGVSLSGNSDVLIQLGTSSGVTSTGYNNYALSFGTGSGAGSGYTTGFGFKGSVAASVYAGSVSITNLNSNIWTAFGGIGHAASNDGSMTMGGVSLAATLDRVRITTANGTDTFDAGSINILYE